MQVQTVQVQVHEDVRAIQNNNRLPVFLSKLDVERLDALHKPTYSLAQIQLGQDLLDCVTAAYTHSDTYVNYRKKFIVVKVSDPKPEDFLRNDFTPLVQFCQANNVKIVKTPNGLLYRLVR